LINQYILRTS
jgi:hypothetical protein